MIQEARYTSPSGKEIVFAWETAKRDTELKTGVFTFPGSDGALVQHQGMGARTFPLVCIFSGPDCTDKADGFEAALIERGVAELQHPIYGAVKVKPVGHIEREDDPVNKLGQSTVSVTFTETVTSEEAAALNSTAADAIDEEYEEFSEAAAADFAGAIAADSIDADSPASEIVKNPITDISARLETQSALETQTQSIIDALQPIAASDKKGFADWLASARELKDSIKNLYKKGMNAAAKIESVYTKALNIGRLTLRLMKLPGNLAVALAEKIKGYSTLTANLINQYKNDPIGIEKMKNAYAAATLALTGAAAAIASGSALSVAEIAAMTGAVSNGISGGGSDTAAGSADMSAGTMSREEAVEMAGQITSILDSVIAFRDEKIVSMEISGEDTHEVIQIVDDIIAFTDETIARLENAISAGIPPAAIPYVNELIDSKNSEIRQLRESQTKSANRSARVLEDAIGLAERKRTQIEAVGGQVGQVIQIIDDSLVFENENKNKLESIANKATDDFVDSSPISHLALYDLVYTSVLLITNAAFALPMQKTITLDRDRQVIELCAELYGTTDYLDDFIIENNFNIDEIELLPMGKKVSYYVQNT
jgi:hypothetical protein